MGNDQLKHAPDPDTQSPGMGEYDRKVEKLPETKEQGGADEPEGGAEGQDG
jgi:hypothetical protein